MSARGLIKQSNVTLVCTTDDPADTLEWHQKIAADETFDVQVLPTWRPEKAMSPEKPDYLDYLKKLEAASGVAIDSYAKLMEALKIRLDFFVSVGCKISDHSLAYVMYAPATAEEIEANFATRLAGEFPTAEEEA